MVTHGYESLVVFFQAPVSYLFIVDHLRQLFAAEILVDVDTVDGDGRPNVLARAIGCHDGIEKGEGKR